MRSDAREVMERDARRMRGDRPFVFTDHVPIDHAVLNLLLNWKIVEWAHVT